MSPSFTSSSDRQGLGRFCKDVALFLAPVLLLLVLFEGAFWVAGDSWPMAKIAAAHEGRTSLLIRPQLFAQSYGFKFDRVRALKPEVICLGTSRVLQIRDLFFDTGKTTFYNGGGMLGSFADIHGYAEALRAGTLPRPKVAIFGIDPWWMKTGLPPVQTTWDTDSQYQDPFYIPEAHIAAIRAAFKQEGFIWPGSLGTALSPAPHSGYPAIGGGALKKGVGFRHDGSIQYDPGLIISYMEKGPVFEDRETPPVIDRLRKRKEQFTPAEGLDHDMLASLITDLKALQQMGVEPLVFLPPWANECWVQLEKDAAVHGWWRDYRTIMPQKLKEAGIPCVGPSRPQDYGLDETTMWDGFHPSEVLMARIIHHLAASAPPEGKIKTLVSPKLDTLARFSEHALTLEPDHFKTSP
jgi:hypothetical protein